jgi:long-chain acyl-CoA synthetase
MTFLETIFSTLAARPNDPVLQELRDGKVVSITSENLLADVRRARSFLKALRLKKGDRCALLAPNSIRWVAMDLAAMAEGLIVVPLYARQAPEELAAMMRDCSPSLICCADHAQMAGIKNEWPEAPPAYSFDDVFPPRNVQEEATEFSLQVTDSDPVTIIYTSGTSGESKGVILTAGNIGHMLGCTSSRLDVLMQGGSTRNRVYHYLPLCFCGSWIMLLTCLQRGSLLTLNTDLTKISGEMREVAPDYFLNVPQLLERMRKAVDEQLWKTGGFVQTVYSNAKAAWFRKQENKTGGSDAFWLWLARTLVFPTIRKKMIGANLKALISGSAPLNVDTQLFFMMLGIPVLQVYGLTETTAICTMDDPRHVEPGWVGPAIEGIEMKLGDSDEIVLRGPNIFPGYWNRPEETAKVLRDGWFHTGDQGERNAEGNWRIIGRIKNLIILGSGHNIPPEPIEEELLQQITGAQQVVLIGNGRSYLTAIVTGAVPPDQVQLGVDKLNAGLPHYKQIRAYHLASEPFTIENGLLTANGKLKRDKIAQQYKSEIENLYAVKHAS